MLGLALVSPAAAEPELQSGALRAAASALFAPNQPLSQVVQQPTGPPPTPRHTGIKTLVKSLGSDVKHLPSRPNALWVVVGSGLALAAHPFDDNVNRALVGNTTAEKFFHPGEIFGELGTLLVSASATYVVGRLRDEPKVSHLGSRSGMGEPPRLQAKPSGGPKGPGFSRFSCSRRVSRLQRTRRMESLAFRRG